MDPRFIAPVELNELKQEFDRLCALDLNRLGRQARWQDVQAQAEQAIALTRKLMEFCLTERGYRVQRGSTLLELSTAAMQARVYVAPYCRLCAQIMDDVYRRAVRVADLAPVQYAEWPQYAKTFYLEIAKAHNL